MKKIMPFEKPFGMKDWLPTVYRQRRDLEEKIERLIVSYGYEYLSTPTLEYYETVGKASAIREDELFKLLDHEGNTVVLRPDMTTPIARLISTYYKNHDNPIRVAYGANVFRTVGHSQKTEFRQVGIECIGDTSIDAQAEVISLLATIFQNVWKKQFQVIIGHVGLLKILLTQYVEDEKDRQSLIQSLNEKNFISFQRKVQSFAISDKERKEILSLLQVKGSMKEVLTLLNTKKNSKTEDIINGLDELFGLITLYGMEKFISFDLSFVPHISYYTGIVFEVYGEGRGEVLGGGGQYDELFQQFDKDVAAIGFGIALDTLVVDVANSVKSSQTIGILYEKSYVSAALKEATKLRQQNKKVCMQAIDSIYSLAEYQKRFETIIFFKKEGVDLR